MGDKNSSKTYSKQELASKYADQKDEIDKVIKKYNLDSNTDTKLLSDTSKVSKPLALA